MEERQNTVVISPFFHFTLPCLPKGLALNSLLTLVFNVSLTPSPLFARQYVSPTLVNFLSFFLSLTAIEILPHYQTVSLSPLLSF